jgi:multiple sugar transport system permease protein
VATSDERLEGAATPRVAARGRPRRQVGLDARHNGAAFVFLAPWIVGMLCLTLGPILASFYLSLTSYDMFTAPEWIGLDNYVKMFTADRRYFQALKVTFTYVFLSVPLKLAFALAVAMLLNRGLRGLGFYRSCRRCWAAASRSRSCGARSSPMTASSTRCS